MPPRASRKKAAGDSEPATKRVKTTKGTTKSATKTRGKKGRLSVLPTLPLDVLYEIFAHLGPGDLISLARTSKSFRSVLLSRQSSFLWRQVLEASAEEGYPPRPEDMTEPAWSGFFFGGSYCSLCAAKTTLEVCWAQRRRLCKSCAEDKLIPVARLDEPELKNPETDWANILSVDKRRPFDKEGLDQYDRNRKIPHAYEDDVLAYEARLQELHNNCDVPGEWEKRRAEFDAELRLAVQKRNAHAILCVKWDRMRTKQRGRELSAARNDRGKEIGQRLLALGYDRKDVNSYEISAHKEYRDPKPLTEKVWTRIQPVFVELVEKAHTRRLNMELNKRLRQRQEAVHVEYVEHILRRVHHSVVPFLPPLDNIYELFPDVKALISPDGVVTDELRENIRNALPAGLSALQRFINERGRGLRQALPTHWLTASSSTLPQAESIDTPEQLSIAQIADLDRAVYVTRCGRHGWTELHRNRIPVHFGLDALAHFCDRDYDYDRNALRSAQVAGVAFDQACHDTVAHICELLGLDADAARPLDLDRLDKAFVCVNCPRDSGGAIFMTWRDAVSHADPNRRKAHVSKRPVFRMASDLEKRFLKAHFPRSRYGPLESDVWGCIHCTDHLAMYNVGVEHYYGRRDRFMTLDNVKKHLQEKHNISTFEEGQDIYFRRDAANDSRFLHRLYSPKRDREIEIGVTDDIVLPSVESEEALEALVVAKETHNQLPAAGAGWPFFEDDDMDEE
ncbi:hypothetical protein PENSPDRAFT_749890 [Peniophora sp. CONT]|nr:hypothetical protein PENSPDRAFT_749890 [Peniophora sp. CONT]